jgi:hypothetical protein
MDAYSNLFVSLAGHKSFVSLGLLFDSILKRQVMHVSYMSFFKCRIEHNLATVQIVCSLLTTMRTKLVFSMPER